MFPFLFQGGLRLTFNFLIFAAHEFMRVKTITRGQAAQRKGQRREPAAGDV
jgi:large-conductance mechanosensitive channel